MFYTYIVPQRMYAIYIYILPMYQELYRFDKKLQR